MPIFFAMKLLNLGIAISFPIIANGSEPNGTIEETTPREELIKATALDPKNLPFGKLIIVAKETFVYNKTTSIQLKEVLHLKVGLEIRDYSNPNLEISREDYTYHQKSNTIYFKAILRYKDGNEVNPGNILIISYRDQESTKHIIQNADTKLFQVLDHPIVKSIVSMGLEKTFVCRQENSTTLVIYTENAFRPINLKEDLIETVVSIVCKDKRAP